jgi:hypothetical protein
VCRRGSGGGEDVATRDLSSPSGWCVLSSLLPGPGRCRV